MTSYNSSIKSTSWVGAIEYCENLSLDGGNWRLPNLRELTSLVDDTKINPCINGALKKTISANYTEAELFYWTSTTDPYN